MSVQGDTSTSPAAHGEQGLQEEEPAASEKKSEGQGAHPLAGRARLRARAGLIRARLAHDAGAAAREARGAETVGDGEAGGRSMRVGRTMGAASVVEERAGSLDVVVYWAGRAGEAVAAARCEELDVLDGVGSDLALKLARVAQSVAAARAVGDEGGFRGADATLRARGGGGGGGEGEALAGGAGVGASHGLVRAWLAGDALLSVGSREARVAGAGRSVARPLLLCRGVEGAGRASGRPLQVRVSPDAAVAAGVASSQRLELPWSTCNTARQHSTRQSPCRPHTSLSPANVCTSYPALQEQSAAEELFGGENELSGQRRQALMFVAEVCALYVPAGHAAHSCCPSALYVPPGQPTQTSPTRWKPSLHSHCATDLAPGDERESAGQEMQTGNQRRRAAWPTPCRCRAHRGHIAPRRGRGRCCRHSLSERSLLPLSSWCLRDSSSMSCLPLAPCTSPARRIDMCCFPWSSCTSLGCMPSSFRPRAGSSQHCRSRLRARRRHCWKAGGAGGAGAAPCKLLVPPSRTGYTGTSVLPRIAGIAGAIRPSQAALQCGRVGRTEVASAGARSVGEGVGRTGFAGES
eukprot:750707-Hanusia_phi.AAC.2